MMFRLSGIPVPKPKSSSFWVSTAQFRRTLDCWKLPSWGAFEWIYEHGVSDLRLPRRAGRWMCRWMSTPCPLEMHGPCAWTKTPIKCITSPGKTCAARVSTRVPRTVRSNGPVTPLKLAWLYLRRERRPLSSDLSPSLVSETTGVVPEMKEPIAAKASREKCFRRGGRGTTFLGTEEEVAMAWPRMMVAKELANSAESSRHRGLPWRGARAPTDGAASLTSPCWRLPASRAASSTVRSYSMQFCRVGVFRPFFTDEAVSLITNAPHNFHKHSQHP